MDNPLAFANCIINDILGENLAVEKNVVVEDDFQSDFIRQASEAVDIDQD